MQRLVLTNATLIDNDAGAKPGATIEIAGERIESVSFGATAARRPDARVVDLAGASVMPGLWNCHYHAAYKGVGGQPLPVGMDAPPSLQAIRAADHVRLAVEAGFTGVIGAGAPYAIDASLKLAIEEGTIPGPRIMCGSRDVSTTGHSQDKFYAWHWPEGSPPSVVRADGPEEFRRAIRDEIKRGSEIIKIFATGGHAVDGVPGKMDLTAEELGAACDAAHMRNAKVRAHIANKLGIMTALAVGVDVIDHGDGLDDEAIEAFLKTGAYLVPSMLYPYKVSQIRQGPNIDKMRAEMDKMVEVLPKANKAGVKILLGDDFGALPLEHGDYADELDFYVNYVGIAALDVIGWGTRNGAALYGRDKLGDIRPGYLADLVVIDGDPLADIKLLQDKSKLKAVIKGGAFLKDALDGLAGRSRAAA